MKPGDNMGDAGGHAVVDRPPAESMAAFDRCSAPVRRALAFAPVRIDPVEVLAFERAQGAEIATRVIDMVVQQICPGYRPLPRRRVARGRRPALN